MSKNGLIKLPGIIHLKCTGFSYENELSEFLEMSSKKRKSSISKMSTQNPFQQLFETGGISQAHFSRAFHTLQRKLILERSVTF